MLGNGSYGQILKIVRSGQWRIERLVLILIFNCTFPCHAHLYGIVLLYFVVACVRGLIHNIVITLFVFFIIDGIIPISFNACLLFCVPYVL